MKPMIFTLLLLLTHVFNAIAQTTISFEYYQRLIFLKIKVNEADSLLFLFDTGANASAIDTKTADKLSLITIKKDSVMGSAGNIFVPYVAIKSVAVGKYSIKNLVFTKYNLSGSLSPPNMKLDGILGTDFLKHFAVIIDFKNKLMTLSKEFKDKLLTSIPFELENGIPRVKAKINHNISTYFRYDSGSSLFDTKDVYFNTTIPIFKLLTNTDTTLKPVSHLSATGIGGNITIPVYKLKSVMFNSIEIKKPFLLVQPKQGYFAQADAVGFFGNNLLEKYQKVVINFIDKKIYLNDKPYM